MSRAIHIAAILAGSAAFIVIIVTLSSTAWMQGCIPFENIFKAMGNLLTSQGHDIPEGFDDQVNMVTGMTMCIKQGLFKVSMSVMSIYDVNVPVSFFSLPRYILITTMGLILAAFFLLISVVLLIVALSGNSDAYEQQSKNNRVTHKAMMLAIIAGLLCLGGMVSYSIGSSRIVHNPIAFTAEFGNSVSGSMSQLMQNQQFGGGLNRGKRDIDLDSTLLGTAEKEYIRTMFGDMDPMYGYSFILGWISVVLLIFVVGLTVLIRMKSSQYSYDSPPIKL